MLFSIWTIFSISRKVKNKDVVEAESIDKFYP